MRSITFEFINISVYMNTIVHSKIEIILRKISFIRLEEKKSNDIKLSVCLLHIVYKFTKQLVYTYKYI